MNPLIEQQRNRLSALGDSVSTTVWNLQRAALADHRESQRTATMAHLRRAIAMRAGTLPEVWSETIGIVPRKLQGDDEPSAAEIAAHLAVTAFALHQQGKNSPMHKTGISLGAAAHRLAVVTDREKAIRRRLQAVALAQSETALAYHLRSIVALLRSADVALDYGRLADDLYQLLEGRKADQVRLRWARDFQRVEPTTEDISHQIFPHEE